MCCSAEKIKNTYKCKKNSRIYSYHKHVFAYAVQKTTEKYYLGYKIPSMNWIILSLEWFVVFEGTLKALQPALDSGILLLLFRLECIQC